jgi:hypothetical protein
MPRYFFDIDDGERVTTDLDGLELDGPETAKAEAVRVLPNVARDVLPDGDARTLSTTVRTADQGSIFRASLTLRCEWVR